MLERDLSPRDKFGETLNGSIRPLLARLGLWEEFLEQHHHSAHESILYWGSSSPQYRSSIESAFGSGWHLDRRGFESLLRKGIGQPNLIPEATVLEVTPLREGGYIVRFAVGKNLNAVCCRYLVDASGRRRVLVRKLGVALKNDSQQVAFSMAYAPNELPPHRFQVEAFSKGWIYRAPTPGGGNLIVTLTDRDLWSNSLMSRTSEWLELFSKTRTYAEGESWIHLGDRLQSTSASVSSLSEMIGPGWIAAGDAAMTLDPLSGQGIEMAVRGGIKAAQALASCLQGDRGPANEYASAMNRYFKEHQDLRQRYYAQVDAWREAAFWRRRSAIQPI